MPSSACKKCALDRKSTRLNSSHTIISYAVFCLKKQDDIERDILLALPHQGQGEPDLVPGARAGVVIEAHGVAENSRFFFKGRAGPRVPQPSPARSFRV